MQPSVIKEQSDVVHVPATHFANPVAQLWEPNHVFSIRRGILNQGLQCVGAVVFAAMLTLAIYPCPIAGCTNKKLLSERRARHVVCILVINNYTTNQFYFNGVIYCRKKLKKIIKIIITNYIYNFQIIHPRIYGNIQVLNGIYYN